MSAVLLTAAKMIREYRTDPVLFVKEQFKVKPDFWQRQALRALASSKPRTFRIAMKACKGPGKTALLAWSIWWFLLCMGEPGEHPKGAATSITEKNIDDNLWPELSKWQQRSAILKEAFVWTKSRIFSKDHPETWWFSKRTWSKSADTQQQSDTLAGLHAKYIFVVLDESGSIPRSIMATAEAIMANAELDGHWAKIMQAGNPTSLDGPLYDACATHAKKWTVIEITGDPDDPNRSPRISKKWAREQIEMYGRDNPWVLVNVFGKFPPGSLNALIGPDEVRAAMNRVSELRSVDFKHMQKRLGIDVARFGDDKTVMWGRQGLNGSAMPVEMRNARTTHIAARAMLAIQRWKAELVLVDDTGHWGHGVIDNLIAAGYAPHPVQFHGKAMDSRYDNRRAEMYLSMTDWIKRGGILANVNDLVEELTATTYMFNPKTGKFLIEPKDQIKMKIGRSPDYADALALTFALPDSASALPVVPGHPATVQGAGEYVSDYDPLNREEVEA